ncbi:hypothetical protein RvY_07756-4 [Ramazzottius varieornatus]|uniref:Uncharacterized protein n=1 Tax=Ramazzottius varieornatus TaxID=947166 RepID=A0A1D1V3D1_RAMVA|nr:hypothetical protein RvY_07756-4 [Ramazzottius varieornatus]
MYPVNCSIACSALLYFRSTRKMPKSAGLGISSSMKQPNPERFVVMLGTPMTAHSAGVYPHGRGKVFEWALLQKPKLTRWEYAQVASVNKLVVLHGQHRT